MWQEIITGIIIAAVFLYVGWKLIRIFTHPEKVKCNCGCDGCARHRKGSLVLLRHPIKALNNKQLTINSSTMQSI